MGGAGVQFFGQSPTVIEGEIVGAAGEEGKVLDAADAFLLGRAPLTETVKVIPASGEALTVKLAEGRVWSITLNKNCTLTFPTPEAGKSFALRLVQDGSGGRIVTWPASTRWSGGVYPLLSTAKESVDVVYFECIDGEHWLGFPGGYGMAGGGSEPQIPSVVQTAFALKEDVANKKETVTTSKTDYPSGYAVGKYADAGDTAEAAARASADSAEEAARKAADALLYPKAGPLWQAADYGYTSWAGDPNNFANSSLLPTAGTLQVIRLKIAEAVELQNTYLGLVTAGSADIANAFIAWYQEGKLLAQSPSQVATWKAEVKAGRKKATMAAKAAVKAGFLDIVVWVGSGTTMPTFARGTGAGVGAGEEGLLNGGLSAENSRYASANTGITTTAPETLGAKTATTLAFWAAVS